MTEKITWTALRRLLSERAGITDKEANEFLNAFTESIRQALKTDKQVRISGLGTFRLQAVAPRKSVNVVTGEQITIPGYNKLVFLPEAGFKELVENSGVVSETDTDSTPLRKLGEQATEIVDILAELGQPIVKSEEKEEGIAEETVAEETTAVETTVEETTAVETAVEETAVEEITTEEVKEEIKEEVKEEVKEEHKKKYHFLRDLLITLVVLLLLLGVSFYFLQSELLQMLDRLLKKNSMPVQTEQVENTPQEDTSATATKDTLVVENMDDFIGTEDVETPQEAERDYSQLIATEDLHQDSRLCWVAYKYYGDKRMWVFLWEANRDHLTSPHNVVAGTPIRIPQLPDQLRDLTNPETEALVSRLEEEYGAIR